MGHHLPAMDPDAVEELTTRLLGIARDVLGDDLQAMIIKGSAVKGDFIPDFSDFDVHLFVGDRSMRGPLTPASSVAFAFQERFSGIDVPSYRVSQIQVMFVSASDHPADWIPAPPGTYRLIHGALPDTLPELNEAFIRQQALNGLERGRGWIDTILARMVDKPDDVLADTVRLAGTLMKGSLYEAAITMGSDPFQTWLAPLGDVLDAVEPELMPSRPATRYYARAWRWAQIRSDGDELRAMAHDAITALETLSALSRDKSDASNNQERPS